MSPHGPCSNFNVSLLNFLYTIWKNWAKYTPIIINIIWKPWYSVPWSQKDRGRGPQTKPPRPLQWSWNFFHLKGHGSFVWRPRPLSFWLQGTEYQGFQMRYIMSLNSQWFQKYEPPKLKKRKNHRFPYLNGLFFDCSTLMARILRTTLAGKMYCTSFKSPDIQFLGARRTEG